MELCLIRPSCVVGVGEALPDEAWLALVELCLIRPGRRRCGALPNKAWLASVELCPMRPGAGALPGKV